MNRWLGLPGWHATLHLGQIDYLQTCWDDQKIYVGRLKLLCPTMRNQLNKLRPARPALDKIAHEGTYKMAALS